MIEKGDIVYFVGIKGTGMTALAELVQEKGGIVSGSDVPEKFYTDEILQGLGISVYENFHENNLPQNTKLVVYSAAYNPKENPEIKKAESLGIKIKSYPQMLGYLSEKQASIGIAGVHGKTTTTAITGTLVKELNLPCSILAGSAVANFNGHSTLVNGAKYFIAETCEYKRNFLNFTPTYLVITSVEPDHLDYYKDYSDILNAFIEYGKRLVDNGVIIYCADDKGANKAAERILSDRPDIKHIPYGFGASGDYKITHYSNESGIQKFSLNKYQSYMFKLKALGVHNIKNSIAAMAVVDQIAMAEKKEIVKEKIASGLINFKGTKRRCEIIGEAQNIIFIDDYAHHPTAIKTTIKGIRDFYPNRRIIVDFMSHTYSRTKALINSFANSFIDADVVFLHKIYASAREKTGEISGYDLFKKVEKYNKSVFYYEEVMDAYERVGSMLKKGDVFITMGAGDNWQLGYKLHEKIKKEGQYNEKHDGLWLC